MNKNEMSADVQVVGNYITEIITLKSGDIIDQHDKPKPLCQLKLTSMGQIHHLMNTIPDWMIKWKKMDIQSDDHTTKTYLVTTVWHRMKYLRKVKDINVI